MRRLSPDLLFQLLGNAALQYHGELVEVDVAA
jgi:hypothetical protein